MSMLKKVILACVITAVVGYGGAIAYKIVTHGTGEACYVKVNRPATENVIEESGERYYSYTLEGVKEDGTTQEVSFQSMVGRGPLKANAYLKLMLASDGSVNSYAEKQASEMPDDIVKALDAQ
jgi:uncharacterized protein (TIGR01655 family)